MFTHSTKIRARKSNQRGVTLVAVGVVVTPDPRGTDYRYLSFRDNPGKKGVRKDGALNPINTSLDPHDAGCDGDTKAPLPAPESHDDIIRANDDAFVGLAEEY